MWKDFGEILGGIGLYRLLDRFKGLMWNPTAVQTNVKTICVIFCFSDIRSQDSDSRNSYVLHWTWCCCCCCCCCCCGLYYYWQSGLPCCCCPYLEQSAPTCHVHTLYVCFPRLPQGFPLQAFLPVTFTASFAVPAQWQLSFSDTLIVLFYLLYFIPVLLWCKINTCLLLECPSDWVPRH